MSEHDDITAKPTELLGNPLHRWQRNKKHGTEGAAEKVGIALARYIQISAFTPMTDDEMAAIAKTTGLSRDTLKAWTDHLRKRAAP